MEIRSHQQPAAPLQPLSEPRASWYHVGRSEQEPHIAWKQQFYYETKNKTQSDLAHDKTFQASSQQKS